MKRLIDKVTLRFFQDDANGEYGVAPVQTFDAHVNYDVKFNAFWNGIGIFHDVWEHYFEMKHKYFQEEYGMNVGGEMAAMGHMWYYQNKLGLYNKRRINPHSIYSDGDNMRETTYSLIQEAIYSGWTSFGSTLESNVPKQKPVDDSELEYQIEKMWKDSKSLRCANSYPEENRYAKDYKRSVKFRKIADLHRWGFREAERRVPNTTENHDTLCNFIDFWNDFTKNNEASDLCQLGKDLRFFIYKEDDSVSWKAYIGDHQIKGTWPEQIYEIENYEYEI